MRWYWADHRVRIHRAEFYALGGFSNRRLHRKMRHGSWTYWRTI